MSEKQILIYKYLTVFFYTFQKPIIIFINPIPGEGVGEGGGGYFARGLVYT